MRAWSVLVVFALGCSNGPASLGPWPEIAAAADEAGLLFASEMALLVVPGNLEPAATPEETAAAAVLAAQDAFDPPECVTATATGPSVSYVLNDCEGSFGLVQVTGTLDVTFRTGPTGLSAFTARATDLTLRDGTVSFEVDATVARGSGERTIVATTSSSGVSPMGRPFSRDGTVTARWMDMWGCLFVDTATASAELMDLSWQTQIEGLAYCVGECPAPDGVMTLTNPDEGALRLEYPGTAEATWSVTGGPAVAGDLTLACGI